MRRLFIALDFPDTIVEQVANLCHGVRGARWTPSHQLHLTLRFIGEVDDGTFEDVKECLEMVNFSAFSIRLAGTGFFPPRKQPRVLWVGVEKSTELNDLFSLIENSLESAGLAPDERTFHPHVTVARLREGVRPGEITPFLSGTGLFKTEPVLISEFHLYSSVLRPEGPVHTVEASYELH